MAKNIIQDMVKNKSSLREKIPVRERIIEREPIKEPEYEQEQEQEQEYEIEPEKNSSRYGLWTIALASVVFLLFAVSFLFSGAKITINPKIQNLNLNENLTATKDSTNGDLSFDVVSMDGDETKSIQGGEEKDVAVNATGTVVIFNAFSITSQVFSINTRIEGSNGKIYKMDSRVVVPGMSKDGTPGSTEVGIHGLEAGEEYNSTPLDFKISAFKNTPKYSKFYARSKGDITDGFKGKVRQVSDLEKASTVEELKNTLQAKLLKKVTDQIPSGYILFKDAVFFESDEGVAGVAGSDGMVPITLKGTLYGFLFEEKKLTQKIVEDSVPKYDGADVYVPNVRSLIFSLLNKESVSFKDVTNISFSLSGTLEVVWKIDQDKITTDVLGKKKGDFSQIMSNYTNIDSADSAVKPFWRMSFPEKSKDIDVLVNYPK